MLLPQGYNRLRLHYIHRLLRSLANYGEVDDGKDDDNEDKYGSY